MGHLADFLAAVDKTTAAGLAMNDALGAAQSSVGALAAENEALKAEVDRLKLLVVTQPAPEPAPDPSQRTVNLWELRAGGLWAPSFLTHPSQVEQAEKGLVFRVRTGAGRSEMGLKDPRLEQVAKEPMERERSYRLRFAVPDGPLLPSKVNLFQFWAKAGENPVFACELTRDRLRFVQKITGKIDRRILVDVPFYRELVYDAEVRTTWSGSSVDLEFAVLADGDTLPKGGLKVYGPTTYDLTPVTFKFGAYCPNYMANNEPEPVVGPEFSVIFQRVEVLEE